MKLYVFIFCIIRVAESCTPAISEIIKYFIHNLMSFSGSPVALLPPAAPPITLLSSPQLPPIAFQVDQPIPQSHDYADEPVDIQNQPSNRIHIKPVDNIVMNITFSPPVHWTFCIPSCGVNDQAVDADDAYEKAKDDVIEAVHSGCENSGVKCLMDSVELQYHPESVLIEDFGPYFDLSGNRYKISGKTVPYKINNLNPGVVHSFVLPMKISFKLTTPIPEAAAKTLRQKVVDYLAARKYVHIS
ncbi:Protein CBG02079 [Caenorhabditis briggsae]|uniref:Protein CBG02079 n=1 Tax=Caenorhabditis briggsae TaxID=6238 RepID=A8WRY0_CAEBR|nr:Protein CBG02079 [Caenorhabditis briggsae]CAP23238.2 Protein CBG02079 [Caenorhabditis briggsae]